jgi:glycosyltransferase involved in cell wall biosynthesis
MPLTILNVGYPLAPVGPDVAGGAEQILSALDRALVAAGHHSIVIGCAGSTAFGTLIEEPPLADSFDDDTRARAQQQRRRTIDRALSSWSIDLIHMHGLEFHSYLPEPGVPVLATLHLPLDWYASAALHPKRPQTYLQCVSASQRRRGSSDLDFLADIENGVPVEALRSAYMKRDFVLTLGRICPEKGFHFAIDAARIVGLPIFVAGSIYPYRDHQRYFDEQIAPRLGPRARFLGQVNFNRKRRLLGAARCLLVPSLVAETSSLVAMEALACGTPVIAFPSGALPEIVEHGVTGFLVNDTDEMAAAMMELGRLDPAICRARAEERFSEARMTERYLNLYQSLVGSP